MVGNRKGSGPGARKVPKTLPEKTRLRVAATTMVVTMLIWFGGSFFGGKLGLPIRYAFLLDFAAIAALIWSIYVVWPSRRPAPRPEDS